MTYYLDPKNDLVFKKIFGEHADLLIDFLNALLPLPADGTIVSIEYLTPEQIPAVPTFYRRSIVDVRCKDQVGRQFIVEMQMFWTPSFQQRMLFNASQAYVQQIAPGEAYQSLCPVYGLGIINEVFDRESDDWYHHYRIVRVGPPLQPLYPQTYLPHVIEGLSFVFIELPKFRPETTADRKLRALWLRFLKEMREGEFEPSPDLLAYAPVSEALAISRRAAFTEGELWAYQATLDAIRSERTLLEEREDTALKKGRAEAARAIARNLLGILDDERIAATTGLSAAEVAVLRGQNP
ncbi:MAG: Rpn family recombination-promoting nuclease/putative transposase [Gammaproteobacteria bacterium]|nr:Rpn family recombination-promoting nuclease/putative transposase [Gammaproteobacteria bacterium]MBU1654569.1 Rpn family recombination-promoting nuclease/putative transposase [Gammaproteobacteria bacterium]MBU1961961.1 Rpn family recombination-promoting nuclease/putative transposase [Gammaproteobacteria bacterium]